MFEEYLIEDKFKKFYFDSGIVTPNSIRSLTENPDSIQTIEGPVILLKKCFSDSHKTILLAGGISNGKSISLEFVFWLPKEFNSGQDLLHSLTLFANKFGRSISVGNTTGYFITGSKSLISGEINSPFQFIKKTKEDTNLCIPVAIYRSNIIGSITWVSCTFCFLINTNKYLTWLLEVPMVQIPVRSNMEVFFQELAENLSPTKNTIISIKTTKKKIDKSHAKELKTEKLAYIEVPEIYNHSFSHLSALADILEDDEMLYVLTRTNQQSCIFCPSSNISREHIFPRWLRTYIPNQEIRGNLVHGKEGETLSEAIRHNIELTNEDLYGLVIHDICESCNTTWMKALEDKAKSILTKNEASLKNGFTELKLNNAQSFDLAKWALLKALCLSIKYYNIPNVPQNTYSELKNGRIVDGFLVEIHEASHSSFDFLMGGYGPINSFMRLSKMNKEHALKFAEDFYIVCIHIGHFYFRISYFDESKVGLRRESYSTKTTVLFPLNYHLEFRGDDDSQKAYKSLNNSVKFKLFFVSLRLTDFPIPME